MKKSGIRLGGGYGSLGHASLLNTGSVENVQAATFFSPKVKKTSPFATEDDLFGNSGQKLQATGSVPGRNNSVCSRNNILSPITHHPIGIRGNRGHATVRATSLNPDMQGGKTSLNFTKTSLQTRAEGQIKPKAYNAWDILTLNNMIKDKIED